jgi:hypothetical protein
MKMNANDFKANVYNNAAFAYYKLVANVVGEYNLLVCDGASEFSEDQLLKLSEMSKLVSSIIKNMSTSFIMLKNKYEDDYTRHFLFALDVCKELEKRGLSKEDNEPWMEMISDVLT